MTVLFSTRRVLIHALQVIGEVETEMAYGAIVRYYSGGIEFHELMAAEDYYELDEEECE